jgi:hypothetical protein
MLRSPTIQALHVRNRTGMKCALQGSVEHTLLANGLHTFLRAGVCAEGEPYCRQLEIEQCLPKTDKFIATKNPCGRAEGGQFALMRDCQKRA